jgi:hypothetical protein
MALMFAFSERLPFLFFSIEKLHDPHSGDALLQEGVHLLDLRPNLLVRLLNRFLENVTGQNKERHRSEADQGEPPACVDHDAQYGKDHQQVGNDSDYTLGKNAVDTLNVADRSRRRCTDWRLIEIA